MKKFLEDLKNELISRKFNEEDINDILNDHEEMIKEALTDGLAESDIKSRFGSPKSIVEMLAEDLPKESIKKVKPNDASYEFKHEGELDINIDVESEDLYIELSKDESIHVYVKGDIDEQKLEVSFDQGHLKIFKTKESYSRLVFDNSSIEIHVELPRHNKITSMIVKSKSGDLEIKELNSQHYHLKSISGDISLNQATTESIQINTVSGDVSLKHMTCDRIHTSIISGDLEVEDAFIEFEFEAHTVSGDIDIENVTCDMFDLDSVSGDVDGKEFYPKHVKLKSVSGDIDITNKEKKEVKILSKKTVSGDINISL